MIESMMTQAGVEDKVNHTVKEVMDKLHFLALTIDNYIDVDELDEPARHGLAAILDDCHSRLKEVREIF